MTYRILLPQKGQLPKPDAASGREARPSLSFEGGKGFGFEQNRWGQSRLILYFYAAILSTSFSILSFNSAVDLQIVAHLQIQPRQCVGADGRCRFHTGRWYTWMPPAVMADYRTACQSRYCLVQQNHCILATFPYSPVFRTGGLSLQRKRCFQLIHQFCITKVRVMLNHLLRFVAAHRGNLLITKSGLH